ncbi:MAG: hypothetical protein ACI4V4_07275 [Eubacterium sp.]
MNKSFAKKTICFILSLAVAMSSLCATAYAQEVEVIRYDEIMEEYYATTIDIPEDCYVDIEKVTENAVVIYAGGNNYYDDGGYEITLVNSDGTFNQVKAISSKDLGQVKCKFSNLSHSTEYSIMVRSYITVDGEKYFGSYSTPVNFCTVLPAVKLTKVSYLSKGKVKISWKKNKNADGYVIQYSLSSKPKQNEKSSCVTIDKKSINSYVLSGLAQEKYYIRVCPFKKVNGENYCGKWSNIKSVNVKQGLSLKELINFAKTDNSGRKAIKYYTNNGVDIAKYKTNYEKVKAIYNWHAKHYKDFADCVQCNTSFCVCIYNLYKGNERGPDIRLAAGSVKNADGTIVIHKWAVLSFADEYLIFDPRLQGYTHNYTGDLYFGVPKGKGVGKIYIFDYWWNHWERNDSLNHYQKG